MKISVDTYPVFEANQVLTNDHLNQIFDYLDDQERLTRANLVGIGIACGLEVRVDTVAGTVQLSRGCGVTSEGYLIVEPTDVELVAYREYVPPLDVDYPPFKNGAAPFALWELFPTGEPNTSSLGDSVGFLKDKSVLLFLELDKERLANCSPNNCDDKGAMVTATVRRLLVSTADLVVIVSKGNKLSTGLTSSDLASTLDARLDLPDLRLPRYDVVNTQPVSSEHVLEGFLNVFKRNGLVADTHDALEAAYKAFRPVLSDAYPSDPFATFQTQFGFLDSAPVNATQVRFLQYYYDLFDDLFGAYQEFRRRGTELLCACCPPEELFPRHLSAGLQFRQPFLRSPAIGGCDERTRSVVALFTRLVEMTQRFANVPALPAQPKQSVTDAQIRITPSSFSAVPLSDKAIPYYYRLDGQPPLYELWNPDRTQRKRANQNLGYRSSEYSPVAPAFVTQALGYDLEPYNFLRIEGHLGKHYQRALTTLLTMRTQYRLPIDVIALRTGNVDDAIVVDLDMESCHFRDLDTLYDALRDELLCSIDKLIKAYSVKPLVRTPQVTTHFAAEVDPRIARAANFAEAFPIEANTVGAYVESRLRTAVSDDLTVAGEAPIVNAVVNTLGLLIQFRTLLRTDLSQLDWATFNAFYDRLKQWSDGVAAQRNNAEREGDISWSDLDSQLTSVIYACRLEAFKSLLEEFMRRVREVKQNQYLSFFLEKNPGIQHKAGVPLGGTFILVYHQRDAAPVVAPDTGAVSTAPNVRATTAATLERAVRNLSRKPQLAGQKDIETLVSSLDLLRRRNPEIFEVPGALDDRVLSAAVSALRDGTVIADFFVPYLCCSECSPIQFVLPAPVAEAPTEPLAFTTTLGCTSSKRVADLTVNATGGIGPYLLAVDDKPAAPLTGAISIRSGVHAIVVLDSTNQATAPLSITVPEPLTAGDVGIKETSALQFTASFTVIGGTPPYQTNMGVIDANNTVTVGPINSGETRTVEVTDAVNCKATLAIAHTIERPPDPLTFAVTSKGCTNVDGEGQIVVAPAGGVAPWQVQIDDASFVPITGPITLAAGDHRIVVRDSANVVAAAQSFTVPLPLKIGAVEFIDSAVAPVYDAVIKVSGGIPPYSAQGADGGASSVRVHAFASGQPVPVTISDKAGCSVTTVLQHKVCTLPCKGIATRCRYMVWMQKPEAQEKYVYRDIGPVTLDVLDDKSQTIFSQDLTQVFKGILIGTSVSADVYDAQLSKAFALVNKSLSDKLGADHFMFGYSADTPGQFTVEHYDCHTFTFALTFSVPLTVAATGASALKREQWVYSNSGAVATQVAPLDGKFTVETFGCVALDKCADQPVTKPDCTFPLQIKTSVSGNTVRFIAVPGAGAVAPAVFRWKIEGSNVLSSAAAEIAVPFDAGGEIRVRLVMIDKNGCWGLAQSVARKG